MLGLFTMFDDKDFKHLLNEPAKRQRAQHGKSRPDADPLPGADPQTRAAFKPGEVRRLLEHTPGFIAVLRGPELTFEMVNAAYADLVGRRPLVGRPAREALPELGESFFHQLEHIYATGQPAIGRGVPLTLQRESGRIECRYIDFVYQPITEADGATTGIFLQGQDVTHQKRTEEQLRLALQGGQIAAWERDLETDFVTWSENAEELFGLRSGPAAEFAKRIHPDDRPQHQEALARALSGGSPYSMEVRFLKPDGSIIWIAHRAEVQDGPEGFGRLAGVTMDITARKAAEIELAGREARYRHDLEAAALVQRSLLPSNGTVGNLRYAGFLQSSSFIGGDTFNVLPHEGGLSFFLIDVCGHGAAAALASVAAHRLISEAAVKGAGLPPATIVQQAAQSWPETLPYFTMIYGQIDPISGQGALVQAGHPHPLLMRRGGDVVPLGQGGVPVGISASLAYETSTFTLNPGDALLLYSDGVVEAENAAGEPFSEERLMTLIAQHAVGPSELLLDTIVASALQWSDAKTPNDDMSALWIRRVQ